MFTGIIETTGKITGLMSQGNYKILTIRPDQPFEDIQMGESIAVDGCCLTVTDFDKNDFKVEASQETARLTILDSYRSGTVVNLERALLPNSRMGGHYVTGHIDCLGQISGLKKVGESLEIEISFPDSYNELVVAKGSIAIIGISLTINVVKKGSLYVNIIPHTQTATTLSNLKQNQAVNLEFDILGKYVVNYLKKNENKTDLTLDKLTESGF